MFPTGVHFYLQDFHLAWSHWDSEITGKSPTGQSIIPAVPAWIFSRSCRRSGGKSLTISSWIYGFNVWICHIFTTIFLRFIWMYHYVVISDFREFAPTTTWQVDDFFFPKPSKSVCQERTLWHSEEVGILNKKKNQLTRLTRHLISHHHFEFGSFFFPDWIGVMSGVTCREVNRVISTW